jgi:Metalloenzyme superfamily
MKYILICCITFISSFIQAQKANSPRNIFIITTDGFRWQEVFQGADSTLVRDTTYVKDTSLICDQFWSNDLEERRKKLLPFFWNIVANKGRLSGNRNYGNEVNVANLYKISYPGYSEIFTGYADNKLIPNLTISNRNGNVFEYLNEQEAYAGKVAAFSSWNVLPYILNKKNSAIPINGGYELLNEKNDADSVNNLINQVQENVANKTHTRYDLLTYSSAKNYIEKNHPKVVFLGLGETDEFAHQGRYDQYLQKAHQFDQMIAELWYYVQTDPFYKNNTTFIITTDHGRGSKTNKWAQHGFWVKGSGETWIAMIGAGIPADGEIKIKSRLYQKQIAATVSELASEKFRSSEHSIANPINLTAITEAKN